MGHWTGTPFCHGSPPQSAGAGGHSSKGKQNSTNHPATAGEDGLFVGNGWERLLTLALRQPWGTGPIACPANVCQLPGLLPCTHCPIHAASHWCPPGWHSCGGCAFDLARNPQSDEVSRMWPERVGGPRGSPHLQTTGPPRCCWRRPHGPWRVGASHPDWHPKTPGGKSWPGRWPQLSTATMTKHGENFLCCLKLFSAPGLGGEASPKSCGCLHFGPPAPLARRGAAPLWQSRPPPSTRTCTRPSVEQRRELAIALAREGFDRKACTALLSRGLCPPTAATIDALKALHPTSRPPAKASQTYQPRLRLPQTCLCAAFESSLLKLRQGLQACGCNTYVTLARRAAMTLCWRNFALLSTCWPKGGPPTLSPRFWLVRGWWLCQNPMAGSAPLRLVKSFDASQANALWPWLGMTRGPSSTRHKLGWLFLE